MTYQSLLKSDKIDSAIKRYDNPSEEIGGVFETPMMCNSITSVIGALNSLLILSKKNGTFSISNGKLYYRSKGTIIIK